MKWSRIALYWGLAAGLALYLQLATSERPPEVSALDSQVSVPLLEGPPGRIDRVVISGEGLRLVCERTDGRWRLLEPRGVTISNDLLEATLETLTMTPPIDTMEAAQVVLADFGLDPPGVTFRAWSGELDLGELGLGDRNPTRTAAYASRKGDANIYVIGLSSRYYTELLFDEVSRQTKESGR